jgi:hypothetical protein
MGKPILHRSILRRTSVQQSHRGVSKNWKVKAPYKSVRHRIELRCHHCAVSTACYLADPHGALIANFRIKRAARAQSRGYEYECSPSYCNRDCD